MLIIERIFIVTDNPVHHKNPINRVRTNKIEFTSLIVHQNPRNPPNPCNEKKSAQSI